MQEIIELFEKRHYKDVIQKTDSLLKKKLSWDNKYDLLIIKIEAQFRLSLYQDARESLVIAKKIKEIYIYYYWLGKIELEEKKDFVLAEAWLKKALNLIPIDMDKERGKCFAELAILKAKIGKYSKADFYFQNAKELLNDLEQRKCELRYLIAMREYNGVIDLISDNEDDIDLLSMKSMAYRLTGNSQKAFNLLNSRFNDSDNEQKIEDSFFLRELFLSAFNCDEKDITLQVLTLFDDRQCVNIDKYINAATRFYKQETDGIDKATIEKFNISNIKYVHSPSKAYFPDSLFSLLIFNNENEKLTDLTKRTDLHENTIYKLAGYLKEKNIDVFRFPIKKEWINELTAKKIPFIYVLEGSDKLHYHLVCGYDNKSDSLLCIDDSYYFLPLHETENIIHSATCLLAGNIELINKAKSIINDKDYEEYYSSLDNSYSLYFDGKYDETLKLLDTVIQNGIAYSEAFALKFSCYLNEKAFDKANEIVLQVKNEGLNLTSKTFSADILYQKGDIKKAKKIFLEIINQERNVYVLKALCRINTEEGNYDEALNLVKEAYNLNPVNRDTIIVYGITSVYMEDFSNAWECLDTAMEMAEDVLIYDHKGWAATMQEDWKKSRLFFEKSLELNPDNSYAYYQLGFTYRNTGNSIKAISLLEQSITLNEMDKWAYSELGNNYELLKQHRKAIQCFEKSISLGEEDAYSLAHIGSNYGKLANDNTLNEKKRLELYDSAIFYLSKACEKNPGYIWAIEELTYQLRQKGDNLKVKSSKNKYKEYYEKAILFLQKAVKINPNDSWLYNEMGYAYESLGDFKKAVIHYKRALRIKNNDYSLAHIGFCYRNENNPKKAIYFFKKSLEITPGYYWAISELAYCYELNKNYNQALKMYYRALQLKPDDPYCSAHVGYIYLEKGVKGAKGLNKNKKRKVALINNDDLNRSIYFLYRAVDIDPNYVWALTELGYCLRLVKRFNDASVYLEKASKLNNRDEWIFNELGYCYEQSGNYQKASESFIRVIELDMNNSYAYAHLGHVNRLMNNMNKAILYLIKALRLNSNYNWAVTELGICLREKGWYKTALGIYDRAIKAQGKDSWLLNDIGYCYEQLWNFDEAERYFIRSSEINVNDDYPLAHLGSINMMKGNFDEAEFYFKKALNIHPAYIWVHNKIAELYDRRNNYSGSIDLINKLLHLRYQDPDLMFRKAYYYRKMGEYEKALRSLSGINNAKSIFEEAVNYWLMKDILMTEKKLNSISKVNKKSAKDIRFWAIKASQLMRSDETLHFALFIIDTALNLEPYNFSLNITKGDILMEMKKYFNSINYYKISVEINPDNFLGWEKLGLAFCEVNNYDEAVNHSSKALELNKNSSFGHFVFAKSITGINKKDERILIHLRHAIALNNQNADAYFLLAELLTEQCKYDEALPYIDKFISLKYKGESFLKGIALKTKIKKALKV